MNLTYIYEYHNYTLLELERNNLLELLSKSIGEKITNVKYIYLGKKLKFGNQIHLIDKAIFSCEILGCRKIILDKNNNWFIKKKISYKKFKMSFEIKNENNIEYSNVILDKTPFFFFYYFKREHRLEIIRNEIINNLPKLPIINKNDLFIYIRSSDIFIKPHKDYIQGPLCFYKTILDNFEFRNVYLIAQDNNNPVIEKLLYLYPKIIFQKNSISIDLSYLINSYNLARGGVSTFLLYSILLNHNLKILFNFKFQKKKNKFLNKINIKSFYSTDSIKHFIMYSSDKYLNEMKVWNNSKLQLDLMVSNNCSNSQFFFKIYPNQKLIR